MFTIILTPFSSNIVTAFLCARRLSRPMLIILLISSYYILYLLNDINTIWGVFFFRFVPWLDFTYLPTLIKCTFYPLRAPRTETFGNFMRASFTLYTLFGRPESRGSLLLLLLLFFFFFFNRCMIQRYGTLYCRLCFFWGHVVECGGMWGKSGFFFSFSFFGWRSKYVIICGGAPFR